MDTPLRRETLRAYLEANRRVQAAQNDGQIMPIAILNTFLGVAIWGQDHTKQGEPITLEHLAENLAITPTTLSTHLRYLSDKYRSGREGLELVVMETYPLNRRQKVVKLTQKGKALAQQLGFILEGRRSDANN
ncbi:hypothetical protein H7H48_15740 [Nitratireductor sp. B36]|uniref:hypothetical protein n=1 Tax=Nitratireductor sp. B36 TaxID=2762059 RepID=UPI001E3AE343|nr:hypothetical protein [Nitratireductor sp. B36]MCC5780513.1 hypothetical protein [Nitratireductor sp. B36]